LPADYAGRKEAVKMTATITLYPGTEYEKEYLVVHSWGELDDELYNLDLNGVSYTYEIETE
jgi:hypothetical protein